MSRYRIISFLAIIIVAINAVGQKMPVYEKKIYLSPEGKLYVQKSMPIYFWLSTSPNDNAKRYKLTSEETPKYANPMYFDAEGFNSLRSPSCVDTVTKQIVEPKQDILYEVYADSKSPVTSISFGTSKIVKKKDILFLSGNAEISFKATDELSGVENIYYSVDSADYKIYKDPLKLDKEKRYIIKYYSVDNVGNVEDLKQVNVSLDNTSPKTSMEIKGDNMDSILSGNASIILKSEDQISGVTALKYKLDEGVEKSYLSPILAQWIPQGEHKLTFYSVDLVGNHEKEQVFNFYVDKTPPTVVQEVIGKSFVANGKEFSSGRSQLKLTTFDNKAGVKAVYYSINGGEFKKYEKPVLLTGLGGSLKIKAYAIDNVNNKGEAVEEADSKTNVPYVDLSGPSLSYNFSGPLFIPFDTVYINGKTKIHLKAFDNESGLNKIEYNIDNGENKTYEGPFSIDQDGFHTIHFQGYDNVENSSNSSFTVFVDNKGPELFSRFSTLPVGTVNVDGKTIKQYPDYVVLFISATDGNAGYERMTYILNKGKELPFNGTIGNFQKNSDPEIIIKAYDKLGNESVMNIEFGTK